MSTQPLPYQRTGVAQLAKFLWTSGGALNLDDTGLGKSYETLLLLHRYPEWRPAIIVCPASIKEQWAREAMHHFGMRADVLAGQTPTRFGMARANLLIVNYDVLKYWLPKLLTIKPQFVALDECQMVCNRGTKRTKAARALCRAVPFKLGLSATPLCNRPAELWPVLNMVRPDLFPSFHEFAFAYCNPKLKPWGWDYGGACNLPELHAVLHHEVMVRRRKQDVLKDLPLLRRVVIPVPLANAGEYKKAEDQFLKWLRRNYSGPKASNATKAEALAKGTYLKALAADGKTPAVMEWLHNFLDSDSKLLAFAWHTNMVHGIYGQFKKHAVMIDGGVPTSRRQGLVDAFNTDPKRRLFVGQMRAAGAGWSCKSSSDVAFAELDWNPAIHKQCTDRIHGLARGLPGVAATAHFLIAQGTIEERMCEVNQKKQGNLSQVLDGVKSTEEMALFDEYMRALLNGGC